MCYSEPGIRLSSTASGVLCMFSSRMVESIAINRKRVSKKKKKKKKKRVRTRPAELGSGGVVFFNRSAWSVWGCGVCCCSTESRPRGLLWVACVVCACVGGGGVCVSWVVLYVWVFSEI